MKRICIGIEGYLLPLWSNTAFKLSFEESIPTDRTVLLVKGCSEEVQIINYTKLPP